MSAPDPRLTLARADLAAEALRGQVNADRYAAPVRHRLATPVAPLKRRPDDSLAPDTELCFGEPFDVLDIADDWAWGQCAPDGYVGYVRADMLRPDNGPEPTHRVATLTAQAYGAPKLKIPARGTLVFGAQVHVSGQQDGYAQVGDAMWIPEPQLMALDAGTGDWVCIAEQFLVVPYIWGGRSSRGLDCSALVQLSRQAAGHDCPRDSDMQEAALGQTIDDPATLQRGDLVFWKGHVGIMTDAQVLLHANAHHMAVAMEPLAQAVARIDGAGDGQPTRFVRLDVRAPSP